MEVVNRCVEWSLAGLEKLAGIPGSVGGAVVMNAGAHGAYMDGVVHAATVLGPAGTVYEKTRDRLGFSYRSSNLERGEIILKVSLSLNKGDREEISRVVTEKLAWRKERQPLSLPSAGSVFKNPRDCPAGRIISELGFKGTRVGGAEVSELHANFIVNRGGARAADILSLVERIRDKARRGAQYRAGARNQDSRRGHVTRDLKDIGPSEFSAKKGSRRPRAEKAEKSGAPRRARDADRGTLRAGAPGDDPLRRGAGAARDRQEDQRVILFPPGGRGCDRGREGRRDGIGRAIGFSAGSPAPGDGPRGHTGAAEVRRLGQGRPGAQGPAQ